LENYTEKCKNNLFEHSFEKENYEKAISEWHFFEEVIDNSEYENANVKRPSCELCEHEDLRWQFVIHNINNNEQLKVGSSCIKQFNIALLEEDGHKIYGKDRNAKVNKLIALARINSSNKLTFEALTELSKINRNIEQNNMFIECWTQLKVNGTLEPKLALFVINNLMEYGIDYKKLDMKIDVTKRKCADQIIKMNESSYSIIRFFLSEKNKEIYDKVKNQHLTGW
jgi:hypothetical protein